MDSRHIYRTDWIRLAHFARCQTTSANKKKSVLFISALLTLHGASAWRKPDRDENPRKRNARRFASLRGNYLQNQEQTAAERVELFPWIGIEGFWGHPRREILKHLGSCQPHPEIIKTFVPESHLPLARARSWTLHAGVMRQSPMCSARFIYIISP